jgi:hypothetical protein
MSLRTAGYWGRCLNAVLNRVTRGRLVGAISNVWRLGRARRQSTNNCIMSGSLSTLNVNVLDMHNLLRMSARDNKRSGPAGPNVSYLTQAAVFFRFQNVFLRP